MDAETRLGELLEKIPNKEASSARGTRLGELLSKNPRVYVGSPKVTDNAQLKSLPVGINKKESHYAPICRSVLNYQLYTKLSFNIN